MGKSLSGPQTAVITGVKGLWEKELRKTSGAQVKKVGTEWCQVGTEAVGSLTAQEPSLGGTGRPWKRVEIFIPSVIDCY